MTAKLITLKSYDEAADLLGGRKSLKLGHNTYLERRGPHTIAVKYHRTDVVTYEPARYMLNTDGWHSVTTKQRLNDCGPRGVYQKNWEWYFVTDTPDGQEWNDEPFVEREWFDYEHRPVQATGCDGCDSGVPHYACMRG